MVFFSVVITVRNQSKNVVRPRHVLGEKKYLEDSIKMKTFNANAGGIGAVHNSSSNSCALHNPPKHIFKKCSQSGEHAVGISFSTIVAVTRLFFKGFRHSSCTTSYAGGRLGRRTKLHNGMYTEQVPNDHNTLDPPLPRSASYSSPLKVGRKCTTAGREHQQLHVQATSFTHVQCKKKH